MELQERIYFQRMSKYSPRKNCYPKKEGAILDCFSLMINYTAKEALSEEISSNIARKEISDLLSSIKQLKKDDKS